MKRSSTRLDQLTSSSASILRAAPRAQAAGKAVGDTKLQADGKADKVECEVQSAVGGIKDALKKK